MNQPNPFKWLHFEAEIILLCVRWYLRYSASLQRPRRDDAGTGTAGRPHDDLPLGEAAMLRSSTNAVGLTSKLAMIPGE